jgi:UDP-N-acetylmuramoylalanine--D-glutamate ligase
MANNKFTVVVGLGITGLSVARFLRREQRPFMLMDSRSNPPNQSIIATEFPDVPCITGGLDADLLKSADEIVVSPGLSLQTPAIKQAAANGVKVIGDIELFARYNAKQNAVIPIVAITGSNGKSTVTTLVGQMARDAGISVAVGGNIGTPVLELLAAEKQNRLYVLELSSFQLETTYSLKAEVAVVLNVSADHMDRYDSLQEYALAKQKIYQNAKWSVSNRQDNLAQPSRPTSAGALSFGLDEPPNADGFGLSIINDRKFLTHGCEPLMPVAELFLQSGHNYANILAALAIGSALDIPMDVMLSTVKNFRGLRHRCEYVLTHQQITYINDSKGTNVGATEAAIKGFGRECIDRGTKIVLIAGGDGKNADFSPLLPVFKQYLRALIVIGKDADRFLAMVDSVMPCQRVYSIADAIAAANIYALAGDVVLLSPACSSLDMFAGFEDRGDQFVQAVYKVAA